MHPTNIFSKLLFALLSFALISTTTLTAIEPTQEERNEMAAKLIPIITMLLMDDDTTAPSKPTLTTAVPEVATSGTLEVEVNGEAGSKVYVNGVFVGTVGANGKVSIPLTFANGTNAMTITLKDKAGNESEGLTFSVSYDAPPVTETGQTKSYDKNGDEVTDGSIKDDGYYQKGVTPSYTRSGEIVTDHITGLEWQDDAEAKTVRKKWEDAKAYCVAKGSGWRLPTVVELQSIVVDGTYNPSIDTTAFLNYSTSHYYWSSATHAYRTSNAWIVNFNDGGTNYNVKSNTIFVRCVR